jgi:hypothetical protein
MTLESIQPLIEMSTRNLPGGKGRPVRRADVTAICEPIFYEMWEPPRLKNLMGLCGLLQGQFTFMEI